MCTHAAIAGCSGATPMSGHYALTPSLGYRCQDEVFKTATIDLMTATLDLTFTTTSTMVTGTPVALTGPAPLGSTVRAAGRIAGDCTVALSFAASFSDPTHFAGSLDLMFSGVGCALTNCENQHLTVAGVRTP